MLFNHIHHALAQVQDLRQRVLENQLFRGYSGTARAFGALYALCGAWIMSRPLYPSHFTAHLIGWGLVCIAALGTNYGALGLWYLRQSPEAKKNTSLVPVLDPLPALVAGAVLTLAAVVHEDTSLLFGVWMCLFGVMNLSSRKVMPKQIAAVGWYYITAGAWYLLLCADQSFTNPWPMGLVFFIGEAAGSYVFSLSRQDFYR